MNCPVCNASISILSDKCPKCSSPVGMEEFIRKREIGLVNRLESVEKRVADRLERLDLRIEGRIKLLQDKMRQRLSSALLSEEEIDAIYDKEIIPEIDAIREEEGDQNAFIRDVEDDIRANMGDSVYNHYRQTGEEVLKIVRSGEYALRLLKNLPSADLSIMMFPFFKAAEKSCWLHTNTRYDALFNNDLLQEMASWVSTKKENLQIKNVPQWMKARTKTVKEVIKGLGNQQDYRDSSTGGCLRTGIALYIFGKYWIMEIYRDDLSKVRKFAINNILKTSGTDADKEKLASDLQELQALRNERIHKKVENDQNQIVNSRDMSYSCLRQIVSIFC